MQSQLQRELRAAAFLGPTPVVVQPADPAAGQVRDIAFSDRYGLFSAPVAMNLTGEPGRHFKGQTTPAQVIVSYPSLTISADPQVGVSERLAWPHAGRRGARGVGLP